MKYDATTLKALVQMNSTDLEHLRQEIDKHVGVMGLPLNALCCNHIAKALYIKRRKQLKADINAAAFVCPKGGKKVFVEESGMDCDGVSYSGHLRLIDATVDAYDKLLEDIGAWADGPFYLTIVTKEQADHITYESRDLAAEAFEDGHPHVLYGGIR